MERILCADEILVLLLSLFLPRIMSGMTVSSTRTITATSDTLSTGRGWN